MGKKKTSKGSKTKKENVRGTQRTYDENESKKYRKKWNVKYKMEGWKEGVVTLRRWKMALAVGRLRWIIR